MYDYLDITPESAKCWLTEIKNISIKKNKGDNATSFQIRKMFNYIDKLVQYQIPMQPIDVSEDKHKFTCPRCNTRFDTDDIVDDFNLCYICGQRFKEKK